MQMKELSGRSPDMSTAVPSVVHETLRSCGQPLDAETRAYMEPRFGHDFSQVRIHADTKAAESAKSVNALAYTVGRDIVFGAGVYSPSTYEGRQLVAHEMAHVVQQGYARNRTEAKTQMPGTSFYGSGDNALIVEQHRDKASLDRRVGDTHDLSSRRFSGNQVLEGVFDNERVLQNGNTGTAVRLIQESLIAQGYTLPTYGIDGKFGSETETAVRQFQIDAGAVKIDGIIGPETLQLLDMHDSGATQATGPRSVAPAAGAPAAPAATGAVFSEDASEQFAGYDDSAAPNWLVVPVTGRRRAAVAITPAAARPTITSLNAAVSTVEPTANGVVVTGVAKGTTEIQARQGGAVLGRLRVSVKDRLNRSAAFHYVCDSAVPPHCSNLSPSAADMRSLLNRVWERQTNVRFTDGGTANVVAPGNLGSEVDWTSPGGGEWNTVTALGLGANYNVFRVWHYHQDGADVNDAAHLRANTIVGDNPCADGLGLAHECGHYLGLNHADGFIMTPCPGRASRRVSKAIADRVNP